MATINFTRTATPDPIDSAGMLNLIASQTGYTVTNVEIHPTSIDVTGSGVTVGHQAAIQAAIDAYVYPVVTSPYVQTANMTNTVPMPDDAAKVVTSHAALAADTAVLAVANKKTAVRFWDAGTFQNGTPNTGDMIVFTDNTTIAGSAGVATFYLTSDHTSSGTALCSTVLTNSIRGSWTDDQANYNPGSSTVDAAKKYVTVKTTKQSANGITLLSTTVLGSITYPAAPNGTVVTLFAIGISV